MERHLGPLSTPTSSPQTSSPQTSTALTDVGQPPMRTVHLEKEQPVAQTAAALLELQHHVSTSRPRDLYESRRIPCPVVTVPRVVQLQVGLLDETMVEDTLELQNWTSAQVLKTSIDPVSLQEMLTLQFEDGVQRDYVSGAVQQPHNRSPHLEEQNQASLNLCTELSDPPMQSQFEGGIALHTEKLDMYRTCRPSSRENSSSDDDFAVEADSALQRHCTSKSNSEATEVRRRCMSMSDSEATEIDDLRNPIFLPRHVHSCKQRLHQCRQSRRSRSVDSERTVSDSDCDIQSAAPAKDVVLLQSSLLQAASRPFRGSPSMRGRHSRQRGGRRGHWQPTRTGRLHQTHASSICTNCGDTVHASTFACGNADEGGRDDGAAEITRAPIATVTQTRSPACASRLRKRRRPQKMRKLTEALEGMRVTGAGSNSSETHSDNAGWSEEAEADELQGMFSSNKWMKGISSYKDPPLPFTGPLPGCTHPYKRLPGVLGIFEKFWEPKTIRQIVRETNRYASEVLHRDSTETRGGKSWAPLQYEEFRAFLSITIYMGLKKLPHVRCYWMKDVPLFFCPVISQIISRERFESITRCLHVAYQEEGEAVRSEAPDKIRKVRWLNDTIKKRCEAMWNLNQQLTVDETMIRYKGGYSPIRQFMLQKPVRFGMKSWVLADAQSNYV